MTITEAFPGKNDPQGKHKKFYDWVRLNRYVHPIIYGGYMGLINVGNSDRTYIPRGYLHEGFQVGTPDGFLAVARGGYHGLFYQFKVEMDAMKGGALRIQGFVTAQGYLYMYFPTGIGAINFTLDYVNGEVTKDN